MTDIFEKKFSNSIPIKNWREDQDGLLRITVRFLKEGVYPYAQDDFEDGELPEHLRAHAQIMEYIPRYAFTPEALKTLEGKAVTITLSDTDAHEWRKPETAMKDGLTVGATAGAAWVEGGDAFIELLIQDNETIAKIKNRELVEVSAAYTGTIIFEDGEFEGQKYQAIQTDFHFNHILLLPAGQGRLGDGAKILNMKGKKTMSHTVKVKMKNGKNRTFKFTNEADRDEAEQMANEVQEENESTSAEAVTNAMNRINELNAELETKNQELAEQKALVEQFKTELDKVLNPEAQEELAKELLEQTEDEDAIVNELEDGEEKENLKNTIKNTKSRSERRKIIVAHVMNKRGITVGDNWTEDGIGGAFAAMATSAKAPKPQALPRVAPGSTPQLKIANRSNDAYARMTSFRNKQ